MQYTPESLEEKGYVVKEVLEHQDLIPFVRAQYKSLNIFTIGYFAANAVFFGMGTFTFFNGLKLSESIGEQLGYFGMGFAIAFALIPLHEFIHVLAYKIRGAKQTSYDANWKKFYFMAVAHRFVANYKDFLVVALAPFVVISLALICLMTAAGPDWDRTIAGILFAHAAMCSGDFALLSYMFKYRKKEMVTYDDAENKVSYFLVKKSINEND